MAIVEAIGVQGLVTLTTPLELKTVDGKVRLELQGRTFYLQWQEDTISAKEIETIKNFVELVYKAGFSDGAIKALLNPQQPAGNYMFREQTCSNNLHTSCCASFPNRNGTCEPTEFKTED